jgi:hypothetical protein
MASRFMLKEPSRRHPNSDNSRESADVLTKTEDARRVSAATLRTFLTDALRACGLPPSRLCAPAQARRDESEG